MTSVVTVNRSRKKPLGSDPSCPHAPSAPGMSLKIANESLPWQPAGSKMCVKLEWKVKGSEGPVPHQERDQRRKPQCVDV